MGMYGDYFIREFGSQQMSSQGKQLKSTLIELLKRIKVQGNLQQRINYAKKSDPTFMQSVIRKEAFDVAFKGYNVHYSDYKISKIYGEVSYLEEFICAYKNGYVYNITESADIYGGTIKSFNEYQVERIPEDIVRLVITSTSSDYKLIINGSTIKILEVVRGYVDINKMKNDTNSIIGAIESKNKGIIKNVKLSSVEGGVIILF